jgi:predicted ATP-dependent endonuclease of OLD family
LKPIKFRIKNYKSIIDSTECYFENGYTVLAGKNESGKTSVLEALRDFGKSEQIKESSKPIGGTEEETEIAIWYELSKKTLEEIYVDFGEVKVNGMKAKNIIRVCKRSDMEGYEYKSELSFLLTQSFDSYCESSVYPLNKKLKETEPVFASGLSELNINEWAGYIDDFFDESNGKVVKVIDGVDHWVEIDDSESDIIRQIKKCLSNFQEQQDITNKIFRKITKEYMPRFILYSSFEDSFPDEITIDQIQKNEFAKDLEKISNFRIENIIKKEKQIQSNHQGKINSEFTEIFKKYWGQSNIKLQVEKDGENIYFWIEENNTKYKPSQRSQGQQWFLSFYIKIVARMQEDIPNVILIDEPGLFLHAKAQKDMLKTLEEKFKNNLIVFSTHSPYLIDENKLNHIRLIEKEDNITTIHNKTWARIKDGETLTPILTAIGLGLGDGIENRTEKNNIICEGMEDVLYMRAFKQILADNRKINFVNGGGANKIHLVGRILEAWKCNVGYLVDNDAAGLRAKNLLLKKEHVDENRVFIICEDDNSNTVDLLSSADFKRYVLENENAKVDGKNSKYITDNKLEKVLYARRFLSKASEINLDITSKKSIEKILKKLSQIIFNV